MYALTAIFVASSIAGLVYLLGIVTTRSQRRLNGVKSKANKRVLDKITQNKILYIQQQNSTAEY